MFALRRRTMAIVLIVAALGLGGSVGLALMGLAPLHFLSAGISIVALVAGGASASRSAAGIVEELGKNQ